MAVPQPERMAASIGDMHPRTPETCLPLTASACRWSPRVLAFTRWRLRAGPRALSLVGLLIIGLVAGCRAGSPSLFAPLHRSIARHDVQYGQSLLVEQDATGAGSAFESAVRHDPKNAAAHAELGRLRAAQGHLDQAARCYREAVRLEPDHFDYALALADVLHRQAETSANRDDLLRAAVRAYAHARWVNPRSLPAALGLADCFRKLGEDNAALETLTEAAHLAPDAALIRVEIAQLHHARGDLRAALEEYDRALELDPNIAAAHNGCAVIQLRLAAAPDGATPLARQRAAAHLRKSMQLDPDQPRVAALLRTLEQPPAAVSQAPDDQQRD
jgi:Tfp pilus assembly protein PilF